MVADDNVDLRSTAKKMMTIEIVKDEKTFSELETSWNALSEASEYPNIFTGFDWQSTWLEFFGPELKGELFVLTIRDESSELIGIAPFYRRGKHLTWIGYGGRTCPEYLGPIVRDGFVEPVVSAIVEFLQDRPKEWNSIFFEDYALDDPGSVRLAERLGEEFFEHAGEGEIRYLIRMPDGFDAYMKTLSSHNRQRKRVRIKKAREHYGAEMEYPTVETLDEWFPTIVDLTRRSRGRHREATPFDQENYAAFHRNLLRKLLPKGRAAVGFLRYENKPAAVWYCFLLGNKCYAYQQGFCPDYDGSPSDVCQQLLVQHLAENGMTEFDFLRGLEWYKTTHANAERKTRWTYVFRSRGIGWAWRIFLDKILRPVWRKLKRRTAFDG